MVPTMRILQMKLECTVHFRMLLHVTLWLMVLTLCHAKEYDSYANSYGIDKNEIIKRLEKKLGHSYFRQHEQEDEGDDYRRSCTTSACNNAADLSSWVQDIFDGVDDMPKMGSPGKLFCFGEKAFPILVGNGDDDIILAISQLGEGRIAVAAQSLYLSDIMDYDETTTDAKGMYYNNMKKWLTKNDFTGNEQFCWIKEEDKLSTCLSTPEVKVLLWYGKNDDWVTDEHVTQVTDFIENGGGLYYADTPWAWRKYSSYGKLGYPLYSKGFYGVLEQAGIGMVPRTASVSDPIPVLKDEDGIDMLKSLNFVILRSKLNTLDDLETETFLGTAISYIDSTLNFVSPDTVLEIGQSFVPFADNIADSFQFPTGTYGTETQITVGTKEHAAFKLFLALGNLGVWRDVAPSAELFPGSVPSSAETKSYSGKVQSTESNTYWHSTGHYLPAGELMTFTVNDEGDGTWTNYMVGLEEKNCDYYPLTQLTL